MIRVFAIYPSFDPAMNEMALVWDHLARTGAVRCTVVAKTHDVLKGFSSASSTEERTNLTIRRVPELRVNDTLLEVARASQPDVIFCAVAGNLPLARAVARVVNKPIVLHTEYFLDDGYLIRRRYHLGSRLVRRIEANLYRRHLERSSKIILSSDPVEFRQGAPKEHRSLRYLPWPYYGEVRTPGFAERDHHGSVFIGSLSRVKGAADLSSFWAHALAELAGFTLTFVGVPVDSAGIAALQVMKELKEKGTVRLGDRMDRGAATELLGRGLFVFSPGKTFGWGLILDAWRTGTPVIARSAHFDLEAGVNCLIANDPAEFTACIRRLQEDQRLWEDLQTGGLRSLRDHAVESVSSRLLDALTESV